MDDSVIFSPYFWAGFLYYKGLWSLLVLSIVALIMRRWQVDLSRALSPFCLVVAALSSVIAYAYVMVFWTAWEGANKFEQAAFLDRAGGTYSWEYWLLFACNFFPWLFLFMALRQSPLYVFAITTATIISPYLAEWEITIERIQTFDGLI